MITYSTQSDSLTVDMLRGFFVGWPSPPSAATLLATLHGSTHVVVASSEGAVVGFINALSDGVMAAYIPLLEVRPEYQGQGIGTELVRQMLELLAPMYMVDLLCDEDVAPFYERVGMQRAMGMASRNRASAALSPDR